MDSQTQRQCCELLILSLEEGLDQDQNRRLNEFLKDPDVRHYYLDFIELIQVLDEMPWSAQGGASQVLSPSIWQLLAQYEKEADPVDIPSKPQPTEMIDDVVKRKALLKSKRKKTPTIIWVSLWSMAAILMILILIGTFPHAAPQPVAKVLYTLDAKWDCPLGDESLLYNKTSYTLQNGYAKIEFENGIIAYLEAPAQFMLQSPDKINLDLGKLTATVPRSAIGFIVTTPNSQIVDLGTEFGVYVTYNSETEVHLFKGNVNLMSSISMDAVERQILKQGEARLVNSSGNILPIQLVRKGFIRGIESQHRVVWRGEPIDLADIVGGGSGLGTGVLGSSIDPESGQWYQLSPLFKEGGYSQPGREPSEAKYQLVSSNPFVDGVFVPNRQKEQVTVSSAGHMFKDAPSTSGTYWHGVIYWDSSKGRSIVLNSDLYGTPSKPALLMHSNLGITFDLDAIRQHFSGRSIIEFSSLYGISDAYNDKKVLPCADFWVLIDGTVKFSIRNVNVLETGQIQIPISQSDRYLTLITTQGENNISAQQQRKGPTYNDWCVWGSPVLRIE